MSSEDVVSALPRIPVAEITTAAAFGDAVKAEKPLMIKGAFAHWPALDAGRTSPSALNAYFAAMDNGAPAPVMEAPASTKGRFGYSPDLREFTFSKRQLGLRETLDRIERQLDRPGAPVVAIQMLPLASAMPDFMRQNPMPLAPNVAPLLWLGGPVKTQIHNDRDHNLACVIAGKRRFVLFPPTAVRNLYIGPFDNPPPLSLVDLDAPDFARFPKFRDALDGAMAAYVEPGDAVFMPKYWWHHVTSLAPYNAMVNYWWGDGAQGLERANDAFLTALLALKDLPPGERAYWKEMFDTYVFHAHGDAVAHIPAELQGPLGRMSSSVRERLKRALKAAYLKS